MAEGLNMGHQGTMQPAPPCMSQVLSNPPDHTSYTEEIHHNLGLGPVSVTHKEWVSPPDKPPNPQKSWRRRRGSTESGRGGRWWVNVLGPTWVADTETLPPPPTTTTSSCCRLFCFLFMTLEKQQQGPNTGHRVWEVQSLGCSRCCWWPAQPLSSWALQSTSTASLSAPRFLCLGVSSGLQSNSTPVHSTQMYQGSDARPSGVTLT